MPAQESDQISANVQLLSCYMGQRQHTDSAIINTIIGIIAANGGLLAALPFADGNLLGKLLPYLGLISVMASTYAVYAYRARLRHTARHGIAIQDFLASKEVTLAASPFRTKECSRIAVGAPDMVHWVIALLWLIVAAMNIPWMHHALIEATRFLF